MIRVFAVVSLTLALAGCAGGPTRISASTPNNWGNGVFRADVVDHTGQLRQVFFPDRAQIVDDEVRAFGIGFANPGGDPGILQISWTTEMCPPPQTITILRDGSGRIEVRIDEGRRVCMADMGIPRWIDLVLVPGLPASLVDGSDVTVR